MAVWRRAPVLAPSPLHSTRFAENLPNEPFGRLTGPSAERYTGRRRLAGRSDDRGVVVSRRWTHIVLVPIAFALGLFAPASAMAARGDFLPAGTGYCASTYPGHPRPFPKELWGPSVDLNQDGGDWGRAVLAPADGKVLVWTTVARTYHGRPHEGWGNSLVWISANGHEQLFVGHLSKVLVRWPQQRVRAGRTIGLAGNTGEVGGSGSDGGAHLHVNRMIDWNPAPVVLSGRLIIPTSTPGANCRAGPHHYVSSGPLRGGGCSNAPTATWRQPIRVSDPEGGFWLRRSGGCRP
jgi:hypothetical protein